MNTQDFIKENENFFDKLKDQGIKFIFIAEPEYCRHAACGNIDHEADVFAFVMTLINDFRIDKLLIVQKLLEEILEGINEVQKTKREATKTINDLLKELNIPIKK